MENQHRKISGYRDLNQGEIDSINNVKSLGDEVGGIISVLKQAQEVDQDILKIAEADLKKGFMMLTRSIAKPKGF